MEKKKRMALKTKVLAGTAVWPHLNEPNYKFKDGGEYSVDLEMDASDPELTEYMDQVDKFAAEVQEEFSAATGKKLRLSPPAVVTCTDDSGDPNGLVKIKCKRAYSWPNEGSFKLNEKFVIVDAQNNPMTEVVGGGSQIKVAIEAQGWAFGAQCGVRFYMQAVQVIELRGFRNPTPDQLFEKSDGFVTSGEPDTAAASSDSGDF